MYFPNSAVFIESGRSYGNRNIKEAILLIWWKNETHQKYIHFQEGTNQIVGWLIEKNFGENVERPVHAFARCNDQASRQKNGCWREQKGKLESQFYKNQKIVFFFMLCNLFFFKFRSTLNQITSELKLNFYKIET